MSITGIERSSHKENQDQQALQLALDFYKIEGHSPKSREKHRKITEEMTLLAIDKAMPEISQIAYRTGAQEVAVLLPLRGALAMMTPKTVPYLYESLADEKLLKPNFQIWSQGVKRDGVAQTAETYFEWGLSRGRDYSKTVVLKLDWGVATAATLTKSAKDLKEKYGIGFGQMIAVGMTVTDYAQDKLSELSDESGKVGVVALTRARVNEKGYVDGIAIPNSDNFMDVNPKDWGDEMWGDWSDNSDTGNDVASNIHYFIQRLKQISPEIPSLELINLQSYYVSKYIDNN
jgi:hypothetical protein